MKKKVRKKKKKKVKRIENESIVSKIATKHLNIEEFDKNELLPSSNEVALNLKNMKRLYASKCKDQQLPMIRSREKRFFELIHKSCNGLKFSLKEHGLGKQSAKALVSVLGKNNSYSILELSGNHFRDEGCSTLSQLFYNNETIVVLDLRSNDIGSKGSTNLFKSLHKNRTLTSIDLSGLSGINRNHIGKQGAKGLRNLLKVNNVLCELNLASNGLAADGIKYLCEGVKVNKSLLKLNISSNNVGSSGCEYVRTILDSCSIRELIMERNQIGDRGLVHLSNSLKNAYNPCITHLDLSYNKITKNGIKDFCEVLKLDSMIKVLKLEGNELGNEGAQYLASMLEVNKRITHLCISKNEIENEGCVSIGISLEENTSLKHLDLSSNYIDKGVVQLCKSIIAKNRSITYIDLSNNRIDDEGGEYLAELVKKNKILTTLKIKQNDIKDSGEIIANSLKGNLVLTTLEFAYNNFSYKSYSYITQFLKRNRKKHKTNSKLNLKNQILRMQHKENELIIKARNIRTENQTAVSSKKKYKLKLIEREELDALHKEENKKYNVLLAEATETRKEKEKELDSLVHDLQKMVKDYNKKIKRNDDRLTIEKDRVSKIENIIFDKNKHLTEAEAKFNENNITIINRRREQKNNLKNDLTILEEKDNELQKLKDKFSLVKQIQKEVKKKGSKKKSSKKKGKKKKKKT